jgi:hypothetical protein
VFCVGTGGVEPFGSAVRVLMMGQNLPSPCILLENIDDGGLVVIHCLLLPHSLHACIGPISLRFTDKIEAYRANRFTYFQQAEILKPSVQHCPQEPSLRKLLCSIHHEQVTSVSLA